MSGAPDGCVAVTVGLAVDPCAHVDRTGAYLDESGITRIPRRGFAITACAGLAAIKLRLRGDCSDCADATTYSITHIATGRRICLAEDAEMAAAMLRRMEPLADWQQVRHPIRIPGLRRAILEAIEMAREEYADAAAALAMTGDAP